jgi:hypothetical protein
MPLMLTTGTTPPITVGNCTRPFLGQVFVLERRVRGAEVHRLGLDLAQAAPEPTDW